MTKMLNDKKYRMTNNYLYNKDTIHVYIVKKLKKKYGIYIYN